MCRLGIVAVDLSGYIHINVAGLECYITMLITAAEHLDAPPPITITSQTDFHLFGVVVCVIHPFTVRRPV